MDVMRSYWERESFSRYDHIIAGSGITGLSLAIELAEADPKARVLVLERGLLPTGASTRNAGFACMGSATELLDDLGNQPEHLVVDLFECRKKGLDLLRSRLGDEALSFRKDGAHELIPPSQQDVLEQLSYLNNLLQPVLGTDAFKEVSGRISEFGFNQRRVVAMIENTQEGSLDSGKMMRGLMALARERGVEIMTGAEVDSYKEEENFVRVRIGSRVTDMDLRARTFSVCTNAFAPQLLPDQDVEPGRGQVLITKPVPGLRFKGIFHFDAGYYYFREIDGRVLIGGGRNLDFSGERTSHFMLNRQIQEDLERQLREMIIPDIPFEVDMRWSGIMAFGQSKKPIIRQITPRVFGAFRMGGMGVALGSQAAKDLAEIIRTTGF